MDKSIATRDQFSDLAKYSPDEYNVLTPVVQMDDIPAGARLSVRIVKIDPKTSDVYVLPGQKLGLTKVALDRLAAAAGISVLEVTRTDDRRDPHVYGFRSRVRMVDPDGLPREAVGTKEVDYRDGAKDTAGMSPQALSQMRKFAAEVCASKALNRALRQCLAIRSSYDPKEVSKPYVVPRLILDTNDPAAKAAVFQSMTNAQAALYGPATRSTAGDVDGTIVDEKPPEQEQKKEDPTAQELLVETWNDAKAGGMKREEFARICRESGKDRKDLTVADVEKIATKAQIRIDELKEDDGVPY